MNQDPTPPRNNSARKVNFRSQEAGGELKMPPPARPKGGAAKPFPGGDPGAKELTLGTSGAEPVESPGEPAADPLDAAPDERPGEAATAVAAGERTPDASDPEPAGRATGEAAAPAVAGGLTLNARTAEQMFQRGKSPEPVLTSFRPFTPSEAGYQEPRRFSSGWVALFSLAFLTLGVIGGYYLPKPPDKGLADRAAATQDPAAKAAAPAEAFPRLTRADNADLDAAYEALSTGKYEEAEKRFATLHSQHPGWVSMEIEVGEAQGHQQDWARARSTLEAAAEAGQLPAEANFQLGLLFAARKEDYESNASFEKAAAIDPSRADVYFRWGECLRAEGKTLEATSKFRSALTRNRDVTVDSIYRLKLWLSELELGGEEGGGASTRIDTALAMPRVTMEALVAGAYRSIKAGKMQDAADALARAQKFVEPTLFSAILLDPAFVQENWRPEFAPFFKSGVKAAE